MEPAVCGMFMSDTLTHPGAAGEAHLDLLLDQDAP